MGGTTPSPTKYVAVSDPHNNRLLIFGEPLSTGESASIVLGASTFTSSGPGNGPSGMSTVSGLAFDPSGNLYVADQGNSRILQFAAPLSNGMNASMVFGQSNFTTYGSSSSASRLAGPAGVTIDASGNLWVDDLENSRVLEYKPPFSSGMAASSAIGQSSTGTSQYCNKSGDVIQTANGNPAASTLLCEPWGMTFDASGNLWVADEGNNRVLEYMPPFSTGMAATLELGHAAGPNAFTALLVNDNGNTAAAAAGTFFNPAGLAFDSHGNLFVADFSNNRVLEFVPPFSNGMAAAVVLGKPDFTNIAGQPATQNNLLSPSGVAFDTNGNLLVADEAEGTLVFMPPFSNGMNASMILGQPGFPSAPSTCGTTASSLCSAFSVATF